MKRVLFVICTITVVFADFQRYDYNPSSAVPSLPNNVNQQQNTYSAPEYFSYVPFSNGLEGNVQFQLYNAKNTSRTSQDLNYSTPNKNKQQVELSRIPEKLRIYQFSHKREVSVTSALQNDILKKENKKPTTVPQTTPRPTSANKSNPTTRSNINTSSKKTKAPSTLLPQEEATTMIPLQDNNLPEYNSTHSRYPSNPSSTTLNEDSKVDGNANLKSSDSSVGTRFDDSKDSSDARLEQPATITVSKHYFVPQSYNFMPEPQEKYIRPPSNKHYRVIFIKAPTTQNEASQLYQQQQQQSQEKTIIYILNKKQENKLQQLPQNNVPVAQSQPEVFFINYDNPEEAARVQQEIQAQYDDLSNSTVPTKFSLLNDEQDDGSTKESDDGPY